MSKVVKSPVRMAPESPTTVRPLETDDDEAQETVALGGGNGQGIETSVPTAPTDANTPPTDEAAPPKPPRPLTEAQKMEQTLKEAFPSVEASVIKAVLSASGGRIERAFNALLQMTDPDAAQEEQPPPPPPRPTGAEGGGDVNKQSQLEADELYARQLAEHYENVGAYEERTANRSRIPRTRQQTGQETSPDDGREHSFLDDDLPVIKENLRRGFVETQSMVNTWFNNFKKKIEETFEEDSNGHEDESSAFVGRPTRGEQRVPSRRSADYDRYDADPELLSDDFAGMRLRSDGTPAGESLATTNANLFKPPPPSESPKPSGRRVAFSEDTEDIDDHKPSRKGPASTGLGVTKKGSKWQPLSTVEPSPIAEGENDPFSLGDSEDERESKEKNETKLGDTDRVQQATADAMANSLVGKSSDAGTDKRN